MRISQPMPCPPAAKKAPTRMAAAGADPACKFGNDVCITSPEIFSDFIFLQKPVCLYPRIYWNEARSFLQPRELLSPKRSNLYYL